MSQIIEDQKYNSYKVQRRPVTERHRNCCKPSIRLKTEGELKYHFNNVRIPWELNII